MLMQWTTERHLFRTGAAPGCLLRDGKMAPVADPRGGGGGRGAIACAPLKLDQLCFVLSNYHIGPNGVGELTSKKKKKS